jgi:hypothetical protein
LGFTTGIRLLSVAMVMANVFTENLNYGIKEISLNHGNICGDRRHQKPNGHIMAQF